MQTPNQQEVTQETDSHLTKILAVDVAGSGTHQIPAGANTALVVIVTNRGIQEDTYHLAVESNVKWSDFSGVPPSLTLSPNESVQFTIPVNIPTSLITGTIGRVLVKATSQTSSSVTDAAEMDLTLATPVGDFSLSTMPSSQTIAIAKLAVFSLTVVPRGGFIGTVPLTCTGPPNSACIISPSSLKLDGSNSASAKVTISFVKRSDIKGTFPFILTGTFGSFWHNASINVTVKQ